MLPRIAAFPLGRRAIGAALVSWAMILMQSVVYETTEFLRGILEGWQVFFAYGVWALIFVAAAISVYLGAAGLLRGSDRLICGAALVLAIPPILLGLLVFGIVLGDA